LRVLRLGGYVAFDVPKTVSGLGALLLMAIGGFHVYVLIHQMSSPGYFVGYAVLAISACVLAAGAIVTAINPRVAQLGWYFGDLLSSGLIAVVLLTRMATLPGLVSMTGRWDFAPATLTLGAAGAFVALHMSVLLGINVARPQRQHWKD
jgi:hypothetical protein